MAAGKSHMVSTRTPMTKPAERAQDHIGRLRRGHDANAADIKKLPEQEHDDQRPLLPDDRIEAHSSPPCSSTMAMNRVGTTMNAHHAANPLPNG